MGIMFNRILCPVDFSEHARHALDYAIGLRRHFGASLTVLHALPPPVPPVPGVEAPAWPAYEYTEEARRAVEARLESFLRREQDDRAVSACVTVGPVVAEIVDLAERLAVDLIVLGTHGRGGMQRLFLGSVAERVVARSRCPTLAIPPRMADVAPVGPQLFTNILCAVDYTPSSRRALDYATLLANEARAQLTLVHVLELPVEELALASGVRTAIDEDLLVTAARGRLHDSLPDELVSRNVGQAFVRTGKPYRGILDVAGEQKADLIVLGAHGGLANLLGIGSTTNHVLREATCPVLCLRA